MYSTCVNKIMLWLQVSPAGIPSPVRPCCQATHHHSSRRGLRKGLLCADTGQVQGQCCLQGGTFYFVFKNLCLQKSVSSKIPVRKSVLKNPWLPKNPWARLKLESVQSVKGVCITKTKGTKSKLCRKGWFPHRTGRQCWSAILNFHTDVFRTAWSTRTRASQHTHLACFLNFTHWKRWGLVPLALVPTINFVVWSDCFLGISSKPLAVAAPLCVTISGYIPALACTCFLAFTVYWQNVIHPDITMLVDWA